MLNQSTIMGRLVRDPELRRTGNGIPVASFRVAVDRDYVKDSGERETDFIDCTAWRAKAEFVAKHFTKGSMVVVSGRLESRNWTDKDGNKRSALEINANDVYFGEPKRSAAASPSEEDYSAPEADYDVLREEDVQLPY